MLPLLMRWVYRASASMIVVMVHLARQSSKMGMIR